MSTVDLKPFLPWSAEAEQSVLGALLLDCQAGFERAQPLQPRQFFDQRHVLIYGAIEAMVAKHEPVDVIAVWQSLSDAGQSDEVGGIEYLNQLAQCVASASRTGSHSRIVRDKAQHRQLLETADKALEIVTEPGGDVAGKLDQITSMFGAIQRQQLTKVPKTMADVVLQRTEHYEALQSGTVIAGWATQFPRIDSYLNGGIQLGRLYILGARPSVGKSSWAQWVMHIMVKAGLKTLFLSQEMSNEELADRTVASAGRINYSALQTGCMDREHWARTAEVLDATELRNFYVDDQAGLTLMDIRAKAKQIPDLKVLVLDYLQLCAGSGRKDANRNTEIEQISRGLKTLSKELGIAVIALSQLNRAVEGRTIKRPTLADLRDSGSIEQDADCVMFLWPVRDLGNGAKLIGFGLDKNRQGRCGEVALHFDGSMQRWGESTESLAPPRPLPGRGRGMSDED